MRLPHARTARAFTLVELMVSIGLVLILILGIQKVFTISSDTVSGAQALSALTRDNRAAQAVMGDDFRNAAKDSPHFVIVQQQVQAISNKDDLMSGANPPRMHRIDRIGFFARGLFRRQTANDNTIVPSGTSNEAFIWYGHLALPRGGNGAFGPEAGPPSAADTPDTYPSGFANYWVLGRMAMLLREPRIIENNVTQVCIDRSTRTGDLLVPLSINSQGGGRDLTQSRYDLAGAGIETIRTRVNNAFQASPVNWWQPLVYRFYCNPKPIKPFTAEKLAQAAPYFIGNVSEFIVEFTGDFIGQDDQGKVTAPQPDGIPDYFVDKAGSTDPNKWIHRVRWYGMRRASAPEVLPLNDPSLLGNTPAGFNQASSASSYICAWHNGAPSMVRILIKLEDPSGILQEGQWCEYVFNVGQ